MQRNAQKDDRRSDYGVARLVGKRKYQQHRRRKNEESRHHRVTPEAVGPHRCRLSASEDKDRAGRQGVEEPFTEDSQRKERLKPADDKQQQCAQDSLQNQRSRRRLKSSIDMRELLEKKSVTRGVKRHTRARER